jgi:hypothetical protein
MEHSARNQPTHYIFRFSVPPAKFVAPAISFPAVVVTI